MAKSRKTISFTVDEADYEKIKVYAKTKGHGGQFPTSTFTHYAVFQMMKKYPLSNTELKDIGGKSQIDKGSVKVAQPDAPRGN